MIEIHLSYTSKYKPKKKILLVDYIVPRFSIPTGPQVSDRVIFIFSNSNGMFQVQDTLK